MKALLLLLAAKLAWTSPPQGSPVARVDFQDMALGKPPRGFTTGLTGGGGPVDWRVVAEPSASGGKVLAQLATDDTDYRFPLCILDEPSARDVSVSVRFRAVAGEVDRAAGLIARCQGTNDYYVTRANALEDNVRLYVVTNGKRKQFAGVDHKVTAGEWHTLRIDVVGPRFAVFFDGERLFEAEDETIAVAGKVGLWTKADSVTWFDDLTVADMTVTPPTDAAVPAGTQQPSLVATIEMPGVEGRIDHLALDAARQHLFVAALANDTLEVLDLRAGQVLAHRALGEPQGVLYLSDLDRIAVTSGEHGTLELLDGATFEPRASVALGPDADNLRYDPRAARLYVAYGEGALGVVDAKTAGVLGRIELGGHPEAFVLDPEHARAFVNVPDRKEVAVVDLQALTVRERWPLATHAANYPMTLLEGDGVLALGCRTPPGLLLHALEGGSGFESLELSGDVDDLFFDRAHGLVYAACGAGFLDVFERTTPAKLRRRERIPTSDGARTCLFVPEEKRLFVACPKRERAARVLAFRTP
jgi:hypothetical protein